MRLEAQRNTQPRRRIREHQLGPVQLRHRLHRLIAHAGTVVERAQLLPSQHWEPGDRSVDVHVGHIRRKLAAAGMSELGITAVRGCGYRLALLDDRDTDAGGEHPA